LFSSSRESFSALRFRTSAIWSRWRSSSSASCSGDFPIWCFLSWLMMLSCSCQRFSMSNTVISVSRRCKGV
jgi:hypothetical protein